TGSILDSAEQAGQKSKRLVLNRMGSGQATHPARKQPHADSYCTTLTRFGSVPLLYAPGFVPAAAGPPVGADRCPAGVRILQDPGCPPASVPRLDRRLQLGRLPPRQPLVR